MHASLLRLGLMPLPRVECTIEEEVVFLGTIVGLVHEVRIRAVSAVREAAERARVKHGQQQQSSVEIKCCATAAIAGGDVRVSKGTDTQSGQVS